MKVNMKETNYYKSGRHLKNVLAARLKAVEVSSKNAKIRRELNTEKYIINPAKCKQCNKILDYIHRQNIFCSSSCAALFNNKQRKQNSFYASEAHLNSNKKTSTTLKDKYQAGLLHPIVKEKHPDVINTCKICKKKFTISFQKRNRKTCGNKDCIIEACVGCRTYPNHHRKLTWFFNKYQNKKVLLESSWEVELAEFLEENKIIWIRPKFIKWVDSKGIVRRYFPDFYLPQFNLYIDPKNPYCMETGKEKIIAVKKIINLLVGNIKKLKEQISIIINKQ